MIAKCYDWEEFCSFLLADSKYVQLVKSESTTKGSVSGNFPIADLPRSVVKLSTSLKLLILEKLADPITIQSCVAKHFGVSSSKVPIAESVICAKAMRSATSLNKPNFKAFKLWFTCWKIRYGLNVYKVRNLSTSNIQICGERNDVPQDNVKSYLINL